MTGTFYSEVRTWYCEPRYSFEGLFMSSTFGGFISLAAGRLVPQHDDSGIRFSARRRKLLAYSVVISMVNVTESYIEEIVSSPRRNLSSMF